MKVGGKVSFEELSSKVMIILVSENYLLANQLKKRQRENEECYLEYTEF